MGAVASLQAGLASLPAHARRWLVLGDMAELGADGAALHAAAGRQARAAGVERLYTLGTLSRAAATEFADGGEDGRHFDELDALLAALTADLAACRDAPPLVLVKGSRGMRMERVAQALARPEVAC